MGRNGLRGGACWSVSFVAYRIRNPHRRAGPAGPLAPPQIRPRNPRIRAMRSRSLGPTIGATTLRGARASSETECRAQSWWNSARDYRQVPRLWAAALYKSVFATGGGQSRLCRNSRRAQRQRVSWCGSEGGATNCARRAAGRVAGIAAWGVPSVAGTDGSVLPSAVHFSPLLLQERANP